MCGIDGFFSPANSVDASEYYRAHAMLRHRGPDDEGFVALCGDVPTYFRGPESIDHFAGLPDVRSLSESRVLLGHRRLSIIDLTHCGHEPFSDPTGRYHLVYNGEVYNYLEIRRELQSLGHAFVSQSDTEVVLAAFMEWGVEAFSRFNGMWALAIWDAVEDLLVISRDRFGIKPLYYHVDSNGALHFASELKYLTALFSGRLALNEDAAAAYLSSCLLDVGAVTFWSGVASLPPGHHAVYRAGRLTIERYWDYEPTPESWTEEDALERFASLFEDSLRLRMRSDVEVGTLLSGGLDSTLIVTALHRLGLIGESGFKSFSAVFNEEEFSEKRYIDETVAATGVTPYFVYPTPSGLESDLDALLHHMDVPFRSLSAYSQYEIYRAVRSRSGVKVVLNGQGADELFGGYQSHYWLLLGSLLKEGHLGRFVSEFRLLRERRGVNVGVTLWAAAKQALKAMGHPDFFNESLFSEVTRSALPEYLRYEDRNSMAFGVEARIPFLDYRIVEFAFTLGRQLKIDQFVNKRIEREYARGLVPTTVVNRADKMGFVSPQEVWQRSALAPLMLRESDAVEEVTERLGVSGAASQYKSYFSGANDDWGQAWRAFCLVRWMRLNGLG